MNKILTTAIAGYAALCVFGGAAMAGDVGLESITMNVDTVDVARGDDWAFKGSVNYTDLDLGGPFQIDGTNLSFAVSRKITNNLSGGIGYATGFEEFGDSYAVKGWVTYRVPSTTSFLK